MPAILVRVSAVDFQQIFVEHLLCVVFTGTTTMNKTGDVPALKRLGWEDKDK